MALIEMAEDFVRKLGRDEVELARQLFQCFQTAFAEGDEVGEAPPPSDDYLARLLAKDDFHAIVAVRDGKVVGGLTAYELDMLQKETRELFIYDVAVAAAYRRQGIGSALLDFAIALSVSRGISALYLSAMADDAPAIRFYETTGLKREDVAWFVREL